MLSRNSPDLRPFENARVLITGGLGFIGSNLAIRLVHAGAKVSIVDSHNPTHGGNRFNLQPVADQVDLHIEDLQESEHLQELTADLDFLFNLAGQSSHVESMRNPQLDLHNNLLGQLALVESLEKHSRRMRVIYTSTRQVYGRPHYLPVDEDHPVVPVDVNGIHKLCAEMYQRLYASLCGFGLTILRLTNCYGPRMHVRDGRQTFLGLWIKQILTGEPITVHGDGNQLRDFNHVDDVVDAMLISATAEPAVGKVYNLGSNEVYKLRQLAAQLSRMMDGEYVLEPFPEERRKIDIGDYHGSTELIRRELGWAPGIAMAEGLRDTIEYVQQNRNAYL